MTLPPGEESTADYEARSLGLALGGLNKGEFADAIEQLAKAVGGE